MKPKTKHNFLLSPYQDAAFTRCPKCERKTKLRKFPLVIHIEPRQLFVLNKKCKYCEKCDLIMVKQIEVEELLAANMENVKPELIGNKYVVFGTVESKDWKESTRRQTYSSEFIDKVYVFKNVWNVEIIPGGWYPSEK